MPEAQLVVAGPNAASMPQQAGVAYVGDADRAKLAELYATCDAFVMPSRFEAYGLVFLEAMSYGLPVVARDAFEMARFVDDGANGVLVSDEDAAQLAAAMHRALTDGAMRAEAERRARTCAEEWTWRAVAGRIAAVINAESERG